MVPKLSELAGAQPRAVGVLAAALAADRLHHAYLLVGAERAAARALAGAMSAALVCEGREGTDACGACVACRKQAGGNHPDVAAVMPGDKDTIGIEQIREAAGRLALKAAEGPIKVICILGIDAATPAAQNALLKTLEEPPGATCFLLTATRLRRVLPTVRSRVSTLRLAPRDRLAAWRDLERAGLDGSVARVLGPLVGDEVDRARELATLGAAEIREALRGCFGHAGAAEVLAIAADLGQSRERADLALGLLEVMVRDALAARHGVAAELLYDEARSAPAPALARAAARLSELRRLSALHVNRTLAVEAVLRALGAAPGEAV